MSTELTQVQQQAVQLKEYLNADRVKSQIVAALPKWLSPDRFLRVIFGAALRNPKLMECSMESILQSVMMCAQLGLEPILGRAYLIPYWNNRKRCNECQFQPGYQGLVDLARRSGQVSDVYAQVVYEADFFEIEYGTSRKLVHKPHLAEEPGKAIGAYCVWEFKDGGRSFEFMPLHEIYKRRAKSQSYSWAETGDPNKGGGKQDSIWHDWEEDMMRKTVVKHSSKLVPSSIEFMEAVAVDDAADTGRRVNLFQGVPMIEGGLVAEESGAPLLEEPLSEDILGAADPVNLSRFIEATMQANRCSKAELFSAANKNPERFLASLKTWEEKNPPASPLESPKAETKKTPKATPSPKKEKPPQKPQETVGGEEQVGEEPQPKVDPPKAPPVAQDELSVLNSQLKKALESNALKVKAALIQSKLNPKISEFGNLPDAKRFFSAYEALSKKG
jgi:recombination protein RecT